MVSVSVVWVTVSRIMGGGVTVSVTPGATVSVTDDGDVFVVSMVVSFFAQPVMRNPTRNGTAHFIFQLPPAGGERRNPSADRVQDSC
jgi:hypothetical protein